MIDLRDTFNETRLLYAKGGIEFEPLNSEGGGFVSPEMKLRKQIAALEVQVLEFKKA